MPLTQRRAGILRLVVHEYIETATPVGSKAIREKYSLPASPATIRNEMKALEGEGLLTHPHTSAGRVPSETGYRFFVESLMGHVDLAGEEKATIRHQFYQTAPSWTHGWTWRPSCWRARLDCWPSWRRPGHASCEYGRWS